MDMSKAIDLTFSFLPYSPPKGLLKEICEEAKNINQYPSGDYNHLKRRFAEYIKVEKQNLLVGNGLDEIIDLITRAWGREVLIPTPTYSQYQMAAKRAGTHTILVNCLRNGIYSLQNLVKQANPKEVSLLWICNPNNPTGNKTPRDTILSFLNNIDGKVVVDECYYEFLGETVVDLIEKYENLIVLRSLSKSFGLAGLRIGFAVSKARTIRKLESKRQPFNVNKMAEKVGERVLDYLDYYRRIWRKITHTKEKFINQVRRLGLKPHKSHTNFVLIEFKSEKQAVEIARKLQQHSIYVLSPNCSIWDAEFSGLERRFIRLTIGTENEMDRVSQTLSGILGESV